MRVTTALMDFATSLGERIDAFLNLLALFAPTDGKYPTILSLTPLRSEPQNEPKKS
jgi:hypothetical protein